MKKGIMAIVATVLLLQVTSNFYYTVTASRACRQVQLMACNMRSQGVLTPQESQSVLKAIRQGRNIMHPICTYERMLKIQHVLLRVQKNRGYTDYTGNETYHALTLGQTN